VRRLRRGKTHGRVSATVDGTGLSPQAVSTYFIRRSEQQNGGKPRYRHYLKWLWWDVKQQVVLATASAARTVGRHAGAAGLVDAAARCAPLRLVLADRVDSEANHQHIRNAAARKALFRHNLAGVFREEPCASQMYRAFPQKKYGQRAKVETIFSW